MSVFLVKAGTTQSEPFEDDDTAKYSYEATDGGVLRVLCAGDDLKWWVVREYSPQGWTEVIGARYTADTSKLSGFGGKAEHKPAKAQVH